jgi:hypothetical protein
MSQHIQMKHRKQMLQHHQNNSENISNHFMQHQNSTRRSISNHFVQHQIPPDETSQNSSCNIRRHKLEHLKTLHPHDGEGATGGAVTGGVPARKRRPPAAVQPLPEVRAGRN